MTNSASLASTVPKHLADAIGRALAHFDAIATGEPTFGWHGRTAGVPVQTSKNGAAWLRIVVARPELARGDWWHGNVAAAALTSVRRPQILAWHEWSDPLSTTRAELMELLPGRACSSTPELRSAPEIDGHWWDALEANLTMLAEYPTDRAATTPESIAHRAHVFFGESYDFADIQWGTSHGDLHWANLFAPDFALVDWEAWGVAPVGSDIANLYLHSLLVPSVADHIRSRFAAVLDSPSGRLGVAYGATRMLARAMSGDYPDLIDPLHATVREYDLVRVRKV